MGEVVDVEVDGFTVVCADGRIKVMRVQPPDGGKKVDAVRIHLHRQARQGSNSRLIPLPVTTNIPRAEPRAPIRNWKFSLRRIT